MELILGLLAGTILGAVMGYRFAMTLLSKLVRNKVIEPTDINKAVKKAVGGGKVKYYPKLSDKEAIKMDENSSSRHADLVELPHD